MKKCMFFMFIFSFFIYLSVALYVGKNVYTDSKKRADTILVLGAKSYMNGHYNPCLEARVQHAVNLYKQGFGKKIIMSGGNDKEDNKNEATTMKQIAEELKVPSSDIILENKSTSTYENVLFSGKIMHQLGLNSVIIVTEPFHSPRASLIAKKMKFNYTVSPTLTSQCWQRWKYGSRYFLREPFAIVGYYIEGKI